LDGMCVISVKLNYTGVLLNRRFQGTDYTQQKLILGNLTYYLGKILKNV
jgi:hypothetical protein